MRKITRNGEPEEWTKFKKRHPEIRYRDLEKSQEGIAARQALRENLVRSQFYLCAYCCRMISETGDKSLNEHIKPQGGAGFSRYDMDYDNIVASCNVKEGQPTCSAKKKNHYDESLFVSPLEEGCEKHFEFYPDGEITGVTEEGRYTCDLLGLNSYALQRARRATYRTCRSYGNEELVKEQYLIPHDGKLGQFADMIQYFYERGYFAI